MLANFITPDARDPRLAIKARYRMLVDGKSVDAVSGRTIDRVSPGHLGVVVGTWPEAWRLRLPAVPLIPVRGRACRAQNGRA